MDAAQLKRIPLFAEASDEELKQVAAFAESKEVAEGDIVVTEGGYSRELLAIEDGTAEVTRDGEHIADLGPGDVFGTRQAGAPTLRVGDLRRDHVLMEEARREAARWLDAGASDPEWLQEFRRTWGQRYGLIAVG